MPFYSVYIVPSNKSENRVSRSTLLESLLSKNLPSSINDVICVKHGFSWHYYLPYFNTFYAFRRRQYLLGLLMLSISLFMIFATNVIYDQTGDSSLQNLILLLACGSIGSYASIFIDSCLSRKGQFAGVYYAASEDEAICKFYQTALNV